LLEDAAGGQQEREARSRALLGRDIFGQHELALAADEATCMTGVPVWAAALRGDFGTVRQSAKPFDRLQRTCADCSHAEAPGIEKFKGGHVLFQLLK
jgi:hypothetical protein